MILLTYLLEQDAAIVQEWIGAIWSGEQSNPDNFNWLGLAEATASRAHRDAKNLAVSSLIWAEVATLIYDRLATEAGAAGGEFIRSSMMLRAAAIASFGPVPGHSVLDIDRIINWFFDNLPMSREEAEKKAAFWRENWHKLGELLEIESNMNEFRELRQIKNRLGVILVLTKSDRLIPNQELSGWLSLREKLP